MEKKVLPILAIVGAVLASLGAFLLSGEAFLLLLPVLAIVAGVFLILERETVSLSVGIVLLVLALVGLFAAVEITIKGLGTSWFYNELGPPYAVGLGLVVAGAVLAARWQDAQPAWLAVAGAILLLVAYVALYSTYNDSPATFGTLTNTDTVPAGILALLGIAPGIVLLRNA